ncbi:MAG: sulfatase-like hydrolase/transferase, partial [Planctomycetota bacterium]
MNLWSCTAPGRHPQRRSMPPFFVAMLGIFAVAAAASSATDAQSPKNRVVAQNGTPRDRASQDRPGKTENRPTATRSKRLPNILLILVDDMGYGDPKCFNAASKIPTPNLDRLAAEGMRFTDAHAPGPLCHMSRYGLMTGRYPFRVDVGRWPSHALIRPGEPTIATVMQNAGYQTARHQHGMGSAPSS